MPQLDERFPGSSDGPQDWSYCGVWPYGRAAERGGADIGLVELDLSVRLEGRHVEVTGIVNAIAGPAIAVGWGVSCLPGRLPQLHCGHSGRFRTRQRFTARLRLLPRVVHRIELVVGWQVPSSSSAWVLGPAGVCSVRWPGCGAPGRLLAPPMQGTDA